MSKQAPLISVCIANYNGFTVIDECLQSVMMQQGNIPVEILVHDDASSDASVAHIRTFYPDAKLIVSTTNVGFCVANNRMVAEANGQYVLLLNNDAALFPDALQTLLSESVRLNQSAILSLPQYDAASGELIDRGCLLDPFFNPIPNLDWQQHDVAMVIGACMWIPKSLWDELDGFPSWFESIAEDMYLCCRARLTGHPVRALSFSGYRHWQGKSFGGNRITSNRLSSTFRRRTLSERNKSFVMVLTYPTPLVQLILPIHLVLIVVEGLLLAFFKRDWKVFRDIYLASLQSVWQERRRLICLRKGIQAGKLIPWRAFVSQFLWRPQKLFLLVRHGFPRIS